MKKQSGYINLDGVVPFFFAGIISMILLVVSVPFIAYSQYQSYKEDEELLAECERNLPRDQHCVIVKAAKRQEGE